MLLPGLAVDGAGMRLGRGGGSYDRVLARLAAAGAHPSLVVLLYEDEVVARVPAEPHDHPVDAVVTPAGARRFGNPGRAYGFSVSVSEVDASTASAPKDQSSSSPSTHLSVWSV